MKFTFFLFILSIILSCNSQHGKPQTIFCNYPYQDLKIEKISNKEKKKLTELDGKFIEVEGTLSNNFEDVAIYLFNSSKSQDALWLGSMITDSLGKKKADSLNSKKVLMIGKITLGATAHFGAYFGTLDSIICLKAL